MKKVCIGIDIGGTNTKFGIIDRFGTCYANGRISTKNHKNFKTFTKELFNDINNHIDEHDEEFDIIAIGVGAPNGNYFSGKIEYAPNLDWNDKIDVIGEFEKYINVPIVLSNDANCFAIGEMIFGGAKEMKNFIVITLGTGLGSGIIVNGELLNGHNGFAGELGHTNTIVVQNGRQCNCGRKGCLETYTSSSGIIRTLRKLQYTENLESPLNILKDNEITPEAIYKHAKENDKLSLKIFDYTANVLGRALANTIALFDPEAIFLSGGIARSGELLLIPTQKVMEENLIKIYQGKVKLTLSDLKEVNAGVYGASALAWKEVNHN